MNVRHKKCEGCGLKQANFSLPAEGKARWCSGCAKGHAGAVDVNNKKCEGCQLKHANFGLPAEGNKRRWCGDCAPKGAQRPGRTQVESSPQKKRVATDPPLTVSAPNLSWGSGYRLVIGDPYEAAPWAGLRVWRVLADREEGCPEETEGGQEEGCPEEEMSPASSPHENGGAFERAGM